MCVRGLIAWLESLDPIRPIAARAHCARNDLELLLLDLDVGRDIISRRFDIRIQVPAYGLMLVRFSPVLIGRCWYGIASA